MRKHFTDEGILQPINRGTLDLRSSQRNTHQDHSETQLTPTRQAHAEDFTSGFRRALQTLSLWGTSATTCTAGTLASPKPRAHPEVRSQENLGVGVHEETAGVHSSRQSAGSAVPTGRRADTRPVGHKETADTARRPCVSKPTAPDHRRQVQNSCN